MRVFTVCLSICIFWANNPLVWLFGFNFRLITAKFSSVRKVRNIAVNLNLHKLFCYMYMHLKSSLANGASLALLKPIKLNGDGPIWAFLLLFKYKGLFWHCCSA